MSPSRRQPHLPLVLRLSARVLLQALKESPELREAGLERIAAALNMHPNTVRAALRQLQDRVAVEVDRSGPRGRVTVTVRE